MVDSACVLWTGRLNDKGYGETWKAGRHQKAHVVAYEEQFGPVPEGMELDHLCRVRASMLPAKDTRLTRERVEKIARVAEEHGLLDADGRIAFGADEVAALARDWLAMLKALHEIERSSITRGPIIAHEVLALLDEPAVQPVERGVTVADIVEVERGIVRSYSGPAPKPPE